MKKSVITLCAGCRPHYQDELHGKNRRVHNQAPGNKKGALTPNRFRCTVCGATKTI